MLQIKMHISVWNALLKVEEASIKGMLGQPQPYNSLYNPVQTLKDISNNDMNKLYRSRKRTLHQYNQQRQIVMKFNIEKPYAARV